MNYKKFRDLKEYIKHLQEKNQSLKEEIQTLKIKYIPDECVFYFYI